MKGNRLYIQFNWLVTGFAWKLPVILLALLFKMGNVSYAQCSGGVASGALTSPTSSYQTATYASIGLYKTFTAISGFTYDFNLCSDGGSASYDTQITIQNNAGTPVGALGYNDDFCGLQSSVTWTATSSGTFRVLVTQYNCTLSGAISATLAYRISSVPAGYIGYLGGTNAGWSSAKIVSTPLLNIYAGGINQGWTSVKTTSPTQLTNIYLGGTEDGWSLGTISVSTPPDVSSYSPPDEAAGVAVNSNLILTFSESIQKGTGNILIKVGGVTVQTLPVTDPSVTVSGATVTINPAADFASSAAVNIEMAAGVFKDLANNNFAGITNSTTWNFTAADIIPPTLSTLSPTDNASNITVNSNLVMTFSETIQKGTGNIIIKEGGVITQTIPVTDAGVIVSGNSVTINPTADFGSSAAVNIEMAAGVFKDLGNNNYAGITNATTWNFTVADVAPPTITSLSPADNAANISINSNLIITFNEAVQKGTGNILIKEGGVTTQTIAVTDANVTVSGTTVTINPNTDFNSSALVNIEVAAGAFKDMSNNNFVGITIATTWNFTIVDITPPLVNSFTPSDNSIDVVVDSNLILNFNEGIQKGTGNILIKEGGVTTQTIAVSDASVTVSGSTVTINPGTDFLSSSSVNIEMAAGVIKDLSNNNFEGITDPAIWNFTTVDIIPPTLSSFTPLDNAIDVAVTTNLEMTFTENIQKGTGNIIIKEDGITTQTIAVSDASVTVSGTTVTINPPINFSGNVSVNIEMDAGSIKDLSNNNFAGITNASTWNFTTKLPLDITENFVSSFNRGGTLTASITVSDISQVTKVNFKSRGISEPASTWKSGEVTAAGNKFEKVVASSDLTDLIGLKYYFEVIDQSLATIESSKANAWVKYLSTSSEQSIPDLRFGKLVSDYQIISVPLQMTNSAVSEVFKSLMPYDSTKWRLFDYGSKGSARNNREYTESFFNEIVPGEGYWLIARNNANINPGEGTAVNVDENSPFTITLAPGWNLIGNPYNFRISWTEVLTESGNPTGVATALSLFSNGTLSDGITLDRYRGGFIENKTSSSIQLKVPVLRNTSLGGGRNSAEEINLQNNTWNVPIIISNGLLTNERGGVGMHPKASLAGIDEFDKVSVPLLEGLDMPELIFTAGDSKTELTKEVVPTQDNFTWSLEMKQLADNPLILSWPIIEQKGNKQLILLDLTAQRIVDMTQQFEIKLFPESKTFSVIFGDTNYITSILDKELPVIGQPYPNPAHEDVNIPLYISQSMNHPKVTVRIYNNNGSEVATLLDDYIHNGSHLLNWKPTVQSGLYFVYMNVGGKEKRTKLIIY